MRSIVRRRKTGTVPATAPAPLNEAEIWVSLGQYAVDARGAFAANTERALRSDITVFTAWFNRVAAAREPF